MSASDRRDQIYGLANLARNKGVKFSLNPEEFTGNKRRISNADPTGKLREGMTGDEYHWFMRGLHDANPGAMETAFPFSSGKMLRDVVSMTGPGKILGAIGNVGRDVVGAMGEGLAKLGHKVAPGLTEALGFHKKKFMNDLSNVGPGLKKEFKKLAGLNSTEESLLNTINKEMTSSQRNAQELLQAGNEDWSDAILGDDIKDAENKIMDNAEKELEELAIAYDPTQDLLPETDENVHRNYWSEGYTLPLQQDPGFDEEYEETREDIFDKPVGVSQNRMPHVPITQEQKKKIVDQSGMLVPNYLDDYPEDTDYLYNFVREQQEKGLEYKPGWEGVINKPTWDDPFVWQAPGHDELVDQIEWNTANRPLDWSGGETPELREDYIKENFITDDWGFNQGGYLEKYDDGGYANMSTFEKLKAINDSIAEG